MEWNEHLLVWNHASVKVMDVRRVRIGEEEELYSYRLPASAFIYVIEGEARICVEGTFLAVSSSYVLHAGKGMRLDIVAERGARFEYYLILYKAAIPVPGRKDIQEIMVHSNPFQREYGVQNTRKLMLFNTAREMEAAWQSNDSLGRLYVKSLLYRFVYELLKHLQLTKHTLAKTDLAEQAKRYILEHYRHSVTLKSTALALGCSQGHLSKLFKNKVGESPMRFLTRVRVEKASQLLLKTEANLQGIAESVGYPDGYTLSRSFKKHMGISPSKYRSEGLQTAVNEDMPSPEQGYAIQKDEFWSYIDNDYHNQQVEGDHFQMRQKKKTMAATAMLCMTLLLSACSGGSAATGNATTGGNALEGAGSGGSATSAPEAVADTGTRTISTVLGDVEVPANPQRVLVQYLMGDVIALGVQPVGISEAYEGAAFKEEVKESTDLGHWAEWDMEAVMKLDPDLIITAGEEQAKEMSKIAPAIYVPYGEITQEERVRLIGQALNKEKEAEQVLADYDQNVKESVQKLLDAGFVDKTISVFEGGNDSMTVMGKLFGAGRIVYDVLTLKAPKGVQTGIIDKNTYSESVSLEVLPEYAGDYIIRNTYDGMDDLSQNQVWSSLPAIQNHHLIEMEFGLSYYTDIYSAKAQVNFIVNALLDSPQS